MGKKFMLPIVVLYLGYYKMQNNGIAEQQSTNSKNAHMHSTQTTPLAMLIPVQRLDVVSYRFLLASELRFIEISCQALG